MLATMGSDRLLLIDCNVLFDAYQNATAHARKCAKEQGRKFTRLADFRTGLYCGSGLGELINGIVDSGGRSSLYFTRHAVDTTVYTMVRRKGAFGANDLPIEAVQKMKADGKAIDAYTWLFEEMLTMVAMLMKKGVAKWDNTVEDRHSASIEASVSLHAGDSEDIMHGRSALRGADGFVVTHVTHDKGIANVESLSKRDVFTTQEALGYLRSLAE
jgi:hypothetical protein